MKKEFDYKKTVEKINKCFYGKQFAKMYARRADIEYGKDFFNFITNKIHCGKCGKIMSPLRSLFHFIHF